MARSRHSRNLFGPHLARVLLPRLSPCRQCSLHPQTHHVLPLRLSLHRICTCVAVYIIIVVIEGLHFAGRGMANALALLSRCSLGCLGHSDLPPAAASKCALLRIPYGQPPPPIWLLGRVLGARTTAQTISHHRILREHRDGPMLSYASKWRQMRMMGFLYGCDCIYQGI